MATAGVSIVSVFTTGGRILGGWACDRASIGAAKVLRFAPFVAVAPLVWAGAAETSVVAALSALAAASITYGVFAAAVPVELRRRTGPRDFARAYGKVYTAWGVAGLAAPWLAGMFYDARGDYTMAGFVIYPSIHPFLRSFVHPFLPSFVRLFVCSFVRLFVRLFVRDCLRLTSSASSLSPPPPSDCMNHVLCTCCARVVHVYLCTSVEPP